MRFLVDECLSVELVTVAAEAGYEAHHVAHVGKAGWKDWNVLRHASANDFVLVTNNAADFRKLYAEQPLHAGLVILIPNVSIELQKRPFSRAVGKLTEHGEPINHVLEVDIDGEDMIFELYELPPASKFVGGREIRVVAADPDTIRPANHIWGIWRVRYSSDRKEPKMVVGSLVGGGGLPD